MATGGPPSPQPGHPMTSSTDCPQCGSLCLGPVILPCGDAICRRCLRDVLQQLGPRAACQRCGQHLDLPRDRALTFSEFVQQMGTDAILDNLVHGELDKATDIRCLYCPNKQADKVCLDCQEYYCDVCSGNHCKSRSASDHVLYLLSQAVQNAPSAARATPTPSPGSSSAMSTSSLDSIRNLPDPRSRDRSRDVKEWKEWVMKQLSLLQQTSREKLEVKTVLQDILSLGQELLNRVLADEQVLEAYQHYLPRFDVIQRTDTGSYVIRGTGSDVSTEVKTESLERRLCAIRQCRQCPDLNAVEMIRTHLDQLLHLEDQDSLEQTSTSPVGSPTSSSTHTPTSPQLPPATPSTTSTFTPRVDVMTATPQRVFTTSPTTSDDRGKPGITAIVCLPDDTLVMADYNNNKVKVMGMTPPHTLSASINVPERPRRLALLSDGLVAVTTRQPLIYLFQVTDTVTVTSRIRTGRAYVGIVGQTDGHLLVSCKKDGAGPAAVHMLTRQGDVVRTVTDSTRLSGLESPRFIFGDGDHHVLVADYDKHLVHSVEVSSGHVTHTYDSTDLREPRQVCTDRAGVVYVASGGCGGGGCVLVRSRAGQWRRLLTSDLSDPGYVLPWGLCLTRTGRLVVSWYDIFGIDSVVVVYDLV